MRFYTLLYCFVAIFALHTSGDMQVVCISVLISNLHYLADKIIKALEKSNG